MSGITRRDVLRAVALGLAAAPSVLRGRYQLFAQSNAQYSARAVRLVESSVVVDLLNQYHEDPDGALNIRGLNHSKRVFDLTEGLIRRGYTDAQIAQILGGNAVRALGEVWPA